MLVGSNHFTDVVNSNVSFGTVLYDVNFYVIYGTCACDTFVPIPFEDEYS